ncbi:MAG: NTPase [Planctomycetota bacterium]
MSISNFLITGTPGIGKTTAIMRLADKLSDKDLGGFYTEEIREGGHRQGFRIKTFSGKVGILAHVKIKSSQRVGRYGVDIAAFEQLVVSELERQCEVMLIDEIGKMECFSSSFTTAVGRLLDQTRPVAASVAVKGGGFIGQVKARSDVEIWQITKTNRPQIPQRLADSIAALFAR